MQMAQLLNFTDIKLVHKFTHSKSSLYSLNRNISPVNPHPTFANKFAKPTLSNYGVCCYATRAGRSLRDLLALASYLRHASVSFTSGEGLAIN